VTYNGPERRQAQAELQRAQQVNEILAKLAIALIVLVVIALGMAWWSSYSGRQNVVDDQRRDCARSKLDRRANAAGWRTAEAARRATAENPEIESAERRAAAIAASRYKEVADALDARSRIDCREAFPDAQLFQFTSSEPDAAEDTVADRRLIRGLAVAAAEVQGERETSPALRRAPDDP
jgi:hypothetical protein